MITRSFTFIRVLETYLLYSETFSKYNRLDDDDKKVIKPYVDYLKNQWREELGFIRSQLKAPIKPTVRIILK